KENRIIITNDKDFGRFALIHKPPGVILLRLSDERAQTKIAIMKELIEKYADRFYRNILIVSERKIRIKPI
ncbi:MAG: DUF5615 family PIN-like protein, partial [Euryarchaeota archaeon]|nr:DUF5615 family PIN-like protein [Euryarchaeota archaeon]